MIQSVSFPVSFREQVRRLTMLTLILFAATILMGCGGMPAREVGMLAGAAMGAEANVARPIAGAVRGGLLGYIGGRVIERSDPAAASGRYGYSDAPYPPPYASQRSYGYSPYGAGTFGYGHNPNLTNCTTSAGRDYRTGQSTRMMTCSASFTRPVPGGTESCYARYVERQTGNDPPVVSTDSEQCTTSVYRPGYRHY